MDKLMEANESKTRVIKSKGGQQGGPVGKGTAKPGNLNSVFETHMVEELQQVVS